MSGESHEYVSRGGLKLEHALDTFGIDPDDLVCADLGCSTGGFVDCLLQRSAAKVFAVDTAYGELAWKLRSDDRVHVMERTNALHADPPRLVDVVTIDLGWTRQLKAIPAAMRWLNAGGQIISLIKPHYEIETAELDSIAPGRILTIEQGERIARSVADSLPQIGARVIDMTPSPIRGGGSKKSKGKGNPEWLALIVPC